MKPKIIGKYRLEENDLFSKTGKTHLKTGVRHKARKGAGIRYIGIVKGDEFGYISSLYPTGKKNLYRLDTGGEALELEIKSSKEVEIRPCESTPKVALIYQEAI